MTDKKYIYESPDGGATITKREFGSTTKEEYYSVPEYTNEWDEAEEIYINSSLIDFDTSVYSYSGNISDITLTGSAHQSDLTVYDEHGKEYSFRKMFDRLENIEKHLTILTPDDRMLEKYEVLRDLYDQYKAAEALLFDNNEDE